MPLALLDNVTKSYSPKADPALKNITLVIEPGELILIYGPNGAGKSTLLRLLGGLEKPTDGKIYLDGKNISRLRPDLLAEVRRKELGFLSPDADLIPILSVFENVELPLQLARQGKAGERRERVRQLLDELGLGSLAAKKPPELSPIERQKTALAAAVIKSPLVILADEPTARLDVKSGLEILSSIVEINKKRKISFLVAGDDLAMSRYLPKVIKLYGGIIEGGGAVPEAPVKAVPSVMKVGTVLKETPVKSVPPVVKEQPVLKEAPVKLEAIVKPAPPVKSVPPVVKEQPVLKEAPVKLEPPVKSVPPVVKEQPVLKEAPVKLEAPVKSVPPVVKEQPVLKEAPVKLEPPVDLSLIKPKPMAAASGLTEKLEVAPRIIKEKRDAGVPVYEIKMDDLQSPLIKPPENRGKDAL
ncbi:MAG: ATP-binding cassette domain-containing protein [Candidatus Margulisbacteria bacterium]|nr:ATP-binding cassette domain-containing protein [Candidatus Margulisiibacteriota bacterium]MBU1616748.1 ATP-binding cassette domain-containing protein [Candidatus Margulisiibacteriota bacterium]